MRAKLSIFSIATILVKKESWSLKSEWRRNYEEPIEMWEELKTLMRKRYIPKHYSRVLKQTLYTLEQGSKCVEEYYKEMRLLWIEHALMTHFPKISICKFQGILVGDYIESFNQALIKFNCGVTQFRTSLQILLLYLWS